MAEFISLYGPTLGLLVFAAYGLWQIFQNSAPRIIEWAITRSGKKLEHRQHIEATKVEMETKSNQLELITALHNQTYQGEQTSIIVSNQQDLIAAMFEVLSKTLKDGQDVHSMQLTALKRVVYENQEELRNIQRLIVERTGQAGSEDQRSDSREAERLISDDGRASGPGGGEEAGSGDNNA